jgi:F-type H+-transporting ATPase subunit a
MTGKQLLILAIVILVLEAILLPIFGAFESGAEGEGEVLLNLGPIEFVKYEMGLADFQNVARWQVVDGSSFWSLNKDSVINILLIDILLILLSFLAVKKLSPVPGRLQSMFEIIVDLFNNLVEQTLGQDGRRHIPMLGSLFLFLWISNIFGTIPFMSEPTRDLNVTVGHMIAVIFVVHFEAIRVKGIGAYLKSYLDPFFIMAPLNVIGELAKGVSLAFRLFGNILGGAIIVMVISYLLKYTLVQVGLNLFFSLFVGTIQAFVFTMLSMTYIAVATAE